MSISDYATIKCFPRGSYSVETFNAFLGYARCLIGKALKGNPDLDYRGLLESWYKKYVRENLQSVGADSLFVSKLNDLIITIYPMAHYDLSIPPCLRANDFLPIKQLIEEVERCIGKQCA